MKQPVIKKSEYLKQGKLGLGLMKLLAYNVLFRLVRKVGPDKQNYLQILLS